WWSRIPCPVRSEPAEQDFGTRESPATFSHVVRRNAEPLCLKFTFTSPCLRVSGPVRHRRKDQSVAVQIGPDEEHRSTDRIERHAPALIPQIVEMQPPMVPPCVLIEGWPTIFQHA